VSVRRGPWSVLGRILWVLFGAYIAVTSLVGAIVGVQAFNGWLAILYGALGVSMGLAAILCGLVSGPWRAVLVGWCLVGLSGRAVLEGDLYLSFVSLPIAAILLTAFIVNLSRFPTSSERMSTLVSGIASILALTLLAVVAPALPTICPPRLPPGKSVSFISYPPDVFPWETAEQKYIAACI
jgi:predicted neutral ceramidase superfamily lipid hydrolase